MTIKNKLLPLALALLCGCGTLIPKERSDSAGVKASEQISTRHDLTIASVVNALAPTVATNGGSFRVESKSSQSAGSKENIQAWTEVSIPAGVKMILAAIGLALLTVAVWLVRRSSSAVNAAFQATDQGLAQAINMVRQKAVAAVDHKDIAEAQSIIAILEAERGKLAAKK